MNKKITLWIAVILLGSLILYLSVILIKTIFELKRFNNGKELVVESAQEGGGQTSQKEKETRGPGQTQTDGSQDSDNQQTT